MYQWVNPQLSIEMLERLQKKVPDDPRVDKQLGEIYYGMGEYGKAIEAYDEYMETSVKGIFAAGDLRVKPLRQVVTAVSDGAVAVTGVRKYLEEL